MHVCRSYTCTNATCLQVCVPLIYMCIRAAGLCVQCNRGADLCIQAAHIHVRVPSEYMYVCRSYIFVYARQGRSVCTQQLRCWSMYTSGTHTCTCIWGAHIPHTWMYLYRSGTHTGIRAAHMHGYVYEGYTCIYKSGTHTWICIWERRVKALTWLVRHSLKL